MSLIPQTTYKGVTCQAGDVAAFAVAAVLAIAAFVYGKDRASALEEQALLHAQTVEQLDKETAGIRQSGATPQAVESIHKQHASIESHLLGLEQWESFVQGLGNAWVFSYGDHRDVATGTHAVLRGELTFLHQSVAEAQNILDVLMQIEALSPMLGVERLTMTTEGDAANRRFAIVKIAVAVPIRISR